MHSSNKLFTIVLLSIIFCTSACSPTYVLKAGYEESKILLSRKKIENVIADKKTDYITKQKLTAVLEAREFSKTIGLNPKNSYKYYTELDKDVLSWLLMASKKDAFELYTWWFPIVGTVPYKGFFSLEDAKNAAIELEEKGFETFIRPVEAYSTLGWFSDPILSTTLKNEEPQIVNTVIHEIFHNSFWYKNDVAKNESLANWTGLNGSINFYKNKITNEIKNGTINPETKKKYNKSIYNLKREKDLSIIINSLHSKLKEIYESDKTTEDKLKIKSELFSSHIKQIRDDYPELKLLNKVNNAELMQLVVYLKW